MAHNLTACTNKARSLRRAARTGSRGGFTLLELLLVTAIIVIVTGLVLANNERFGGQVQLQALAYDVGLTIRHAQAYGTAVQKTGSGSYNTAYGVRFSAGTSYSLFADTNDNGMYNNGELLETTSMSGNFRINRLYATPPGGVEAQVTTLDIIFKRPTPDAWISATGQSCIASGVNCKESAKIELISPDGDLAYVTVWVNGQISVGQ